MYTRRPVFGDFDSSRNDRKSFEWLSVSDQDVLRGLAMPRLRRARVAGGRRGAGRGESFSLVETRWTFWKKRMKECLYKQMKMHIADGYPADLRSLADALCNISIIHLLPPLTELYWCFVSVFRVHSTTTNRVLIPGDVFIQI